MPVPLPENDSPLGSGPVSVMAGAGVPVVVTVYVPATPMVKVAVGGLVMVGASAMVSVKFWVALPTLLVAVKTIG